MKPENGGRIELKLAESAESSARYLLTAHLPEAEAQASALLDVARGTVELEPWRGQAPPLWLESFARALLRTLLRDRGAAQEWPRRLTRWRPEPAS